MSSGRKVSLQGVNSINVVISNYLSTKQKTDKRLRIVAYVLCSNSSKTPAASSTVTILPSIVI